MHPEQMTKIHRLVDRDGRYRREAYVFVLEALTFTQQKFKKLGQRGHISGRELCGGIRELAERQFGYLAKTVFAQWGVTRTEDFGEIVFALVEDEHLSKQESDSKEDFAGVYDFDEVFEKRLVTD